MNPLEELTEEKRKNPMDDLSPEKRQIAFSIMLILFQKEMEDFAFHLAANTLIPVLNDIREHCSRSCTAEHCNNCALRKHKEKT